jgi:hypothetical protein
MGFHDRNGKYHEYRTPLLLSLNDFRESDANGDVGDTTANGGVLSSNTTPILRGAANLISQEISWAASNSDPIVCQVALPEDFDGGEAVYVELWVSSGTTNAATVEVKSSWDAGATVTDTATGQASATVHKTTATIAPADIPDGASFVTLLLTPAAHTTNALQLHSARMSYVSKRG